MIITLLSQLLLDSLFIKFFINNKNKGENILFVRLDGIGDSIIWINTFYNFELHKESYKKNILVTREEYSELYKKSGIFDQIIVINIQKFEKSFNYRYNIYQAINKLNIKTAVNPVYSNLLNSFSDTIIFSTKAKSRIIGPTYKSTSTIAGILRKFKALAYNYKIDFQHNENKHEIIYNLNIFINLNYSKSRIIKSLNFDSLQTHQFLRNKKYIVIAPGSSSCVKNWPIERYIYIIKYLLSLNYEIVCIGSIKEKSLCDIIENQCKVINLCGKTTIVEICNIISNSILVLSNDTSSIHIAASCKIPSICISWGGGYGRFLPYPIDERVKNFTNPIVIQNYLQCINCKNDCVNLYNNCYANCLNLIDVDIVVNKIKEVLSKII